jgi:hypothetical protein
MKRILLCLLCFSLIVSCGVSKDNPTDPSPYFASEPPGQTAKLFAPGIISTDENELNLTISPDGQEIFFTVGNRGINTIQTVKYINGQWTDRETASFSGEFSDVDPYITSTGNRLYYSSKRPVNNSGDSKDSDLWYVEKAESGNWGEPKHLEKINNIGIDDYYTSIAKNGNLYYSVFSSRNKGDLFYATLEDSIYIATYKIEEPVNSSYNEHDPFIAPDESYLLFSSDRPGGMGRNDIYVTFKNEDGSWTKPKNMGGKINSEGYDFCPILSPDEKYLFFTRYINGDGNIFWIDAGIIGGYK